MKYTLFICLFSKNKIYINIIAILLIINLFTILYLFKNVSMFLIMTKHNILEIIFN